MKKNKFENDDCVELLNEVVIGHIKAQHKLKDYAFILLEKGTKGMIEKHMHPFHYLVNIASVKYIIRQDALKIYRKSWWPSTKGYLKFKRESCQKT